MNFKILVTITFFSINSMFGQGIEFFQGEWTEALEKAEKEQKLIFVDAFAKWCGPCKRMAKTVFKNEAVGEYMNANFINLKIDMEETKGRKFGQKYPVSAYPTLLYIDDKGTVVKKKVGGMQAKEFLSLTKSIVASYDRSGEFAEQYEKGNRDYELVLGYVKALNKASKSSLKISNEYLRNNNSLSKEQRAEFLFESLTHADSRLFDLFINERPQLELVKSKEAVMSKIEAACWNTVNNAIDFEAYDLVKEAQAKMKDYCGKRSKNFVVTADYEYSKAVADGVLISKSAEALAKMKKDNEEDLRLLAEELMAYTKTHEKVAKTSEKIAKMATKRAKDPDTYLTYSMILLENNKEKEALKSAKKARVLAADDEKKQREVDQLIDAIETSIDK